LETSTVHYELVQAHSSEKLKEEIATLIERNWYPLGGVTSHYNPQNTEGTREVYTQAMVKEGKKGRLNLF